MPTTPAATTIRPLTTTPYITTGEYRLAPTGVDTSNLVRGDAAASEAQLAGRILSASSMIDTYFCGQILAATVDPGPVDLHDALDRLRAAGEPH